MLLKILKSEGGDEYTSREFESLYEEIEIQNEISAPYTPQHNDLVERRNMTIVNMTKWILKENNLPRDFWGKAITTSCYVFNMSLTKRFYIVPKEIWLGPTPYVKHLRILGSLHFKHIIHQRSKKLEDKSKVMIPMSYHFTGSYQLHNSLTKRIGAKRDITINRKNYKIVRVKMLPHI